MKRLRVVQLRHDLDLLPESSHRHIPRVTPMEQLFQAKCCFFFSAEAYALVVSQVCLQNMPSRQMITSTFQFSQYLVLLIPCLNVIVFQRLLGVQLGALFSPAFLFPQNQVWIVLAPASSANFGSFVVLLYLWFFYICGEARVLAIPSRES